MKAPREAYVKALQEKVSAVCIDQAGEGVCRPGGGFTCRLQAFLDQIVEAIEGVESERIEDYVEAVRDKICSICEYREPDGSCPLRDTADCDLDRYLALVIEAVEEVAASGSALDM
ncbi:MAG: hypothetical protein D6736_15260 [Nitrospinota bacterium]|nr:MAG: hypothetical protein D6736_15260 [Nitrospinota bacterium]